MEESQPVSGIDPQIVRDHGGVLKALEKEIRDIEREALAMRARLAQHYDVPRPRRSDRGRRRARYLAAPS